MAAFVVALATHAIGWTVACPPRPKICTKQPWCRSPPSFIFLFGSVLSHRSRQVWAESLRPSTPGAVPVQAQARHPTKKQKNNSSGEPPKSHHGSPLHEHTHLLQSISRFGAPRTPPQAPIYMIIHANTHSRILSHTKPGAEEVYVKIHTTMYVHI